MFRMCVLALTLIAAATVQGEDWPQFRGPGGQGHSTAKDLPLHWSESRNVRWKAPIVGRGWSSPVVLDKLVWLTTSVETEASLQEKQQALERVGMPVPAPHFARQVILKAIALDYSSGRIAHDVSLFEVNEPVVINATNSYASPTPVAQAGRIYCDFGAMGTACLDTGSGKVLWSRRFVVEHQVGPGSSPILYQNLLILTRDGCDQQYLVALDKATGKTIWKTDRPPIDAPEPYYRKAFSTPLVFQEAGLAHMVAAGAQWIVCYDPATGAERWRVDTGGTFSNSSRPVYGDGRIYVCTAYGGTRMLAIDSNAGGKVVWQVKRATPKRSSPLLADGRLYLASDVGVASCVEPQTGEIKWNKRLDAPHAASPVFADGRLYFFGENGVTTVLRPGDQFHRLAQNQIDGRIMASPAMVGGAIILRSDTHLYRIEQQQGTISGN